MPEWSTTLLHLYWTRRNLRSWDNAGRVSIYRKIQKEKRRLEEVGVDQEEIRLLCRHLANPQNKHSRIRYETYAKQLKLPL